MKKPGTIDLALILIWPILAAIIVLASKANLLVSTLIFAGVPSIYLSFRAKENIDKALIFSLMGIPIGIAFDYIGTISGSWIVPSVFPFKLFGIVTMEFIIWGLIMTYFIIMFYEYFLHKHVTKKMWQPRLKYLFFIWVILFGIFAIFFFNFPLKLSIPYFYLLFGIILFAIPISIELYLQPNFISKFIKAGAYFFYIFFIHEVTSLQLGHWAFPGRYFIGWVEIFNVRFPIEELVFFIILFSVATLTFYQFFDDYQK